MDDLISLIFAALRDWDFPDARAALPFPNPTDLFNMNLGEGARVAGRER